MRALSASRLLAVWERGLTQTHLQRALTLLAAAFPDAPPESLAKLSIGQRDARLLALREWVFGPRLTSLADCPNCDERLELSFSTEGVRGPEADQPLLGEPGESSEPLSLDVAGYRVRFRLPNSLDLIAIGEGANSGETRLRLLERCLLAALRDGKSRTAAQLPPQVVEAIAERMAEADPQGDVQLSLACPACSHRWQMPFDIVSYFWTEIHAWAQRTLQEVHVLASAYGWREADVLALSPWRRRYYIEMVSG